MAPKGPTLIAQIIVPVVWLLCVAMVCALAFYALRVHMQRNLIEGVLKAQCERMDNFDACIATVKSYLGEYDKKYVHEHDMLRGALKNLDRETERSNGYGNALESHKDTIDKLTVRFENALAAQESLHTKIAEVDAKHTAASVALASQWVGEVKDLKLHQAVAIEQQNQVFPGRKFRPG